MNKRADTMPAPRSRRPIVKIEDLAPRDDVKGGGGRWIFGQGTSPGGPRGVQTTGAKKSGRKP